MNCPKCESKAYVIDTRPTTEYKGATRRRYMCYKCRNRFSTYEVMPKTLESGEKAKELLKMVSEFAEGVVE